ncbi:cyclopropane fatty-acyl-phospholipid synthase-like methyltransferase [Mesorhizobium soli]|nr:cyclopropane fatty-acyl-phospholipid synthase-like methyltransferase [Mesorhizobium soli]
MSLLSKGSLQNLGYDVKQELHGGGYDDGYMAVPCLWGTQPGSLVQEVLSTGNFGSSTKVLDLGCGEGKNSAAFARAGCEVDAVDCSLPAITNGRNAFADAQIRWFNQDVLDFVCGRERYDVVICYGLFHCLRAASSIESIIARVQDATRKGGLNIVCAFNDRSHDLSAHPGFCPTLLPHTWYVSRYARWSLSHASDSDLHEAHPHNGIPHHHSLTRIIARKP